MLKVTHGYVGVKVANYLGIRGINMLALVWGSIEPDCVPSCFYATHTYDRWFRHFNNMRFRLLSMNKGISYYYSLGKEMHLCADFFTRAHNKNNFIDFCKGHSKWERTLNREVINRFNVLTGCKEHISELHKKYLEEEASVLVDVGYISVAVSSLVNTI